VVALEPGSPAALAGLATGDIVVRLDGQKVTGADDLIRLLTGERIARSVELELLRGTALRQLTLTPEERAERTRKN
jgi:S1-C subfamily serine protease